MSDKVAAKVSGSRHIKKGSRKGSRKSSKGANKKDALNFNSILNDLPMGNQGANLQQQMMGNPMGGMPMGGMDMGMGGMMGNPMGGMPMGDMGGMMGNPMGGMPMGGMGMGGMPMGGMGGPMMMGAQDIKNVDPLHVQYMAPLNPQMNANNYGIGAETAMQGSQQSGLAKQFNGMNIQAPAPQQAPPQYAPAGSQMYGGFYGSRRI
jgi:hypothetical protein